MNNKFEFISKQKIIKLSYDNIFFVVGTDDDFYVDMFNSLQGKNDTAFYNLKSISKNYFTVVEIDDTQNIETELKYGSKSIIWKIINKICNENIDEVNLHFDIIKEEFKKIEELINNDICYEFDIQNSQIDFSNLIKTFYKPMVVSDEKNIAKHIFKYKYLFEYYKNYDNVFILLKDSALENDTLLLKEILDLKSIYPTITICVFTSNANIVFHFADEYPIYFSSFQYAGYNKILDEMNSVLDIDDNIIRNDKLFLINLLSNKRPLEYLENFKKLSNYELNIENYNKIINFLLFLADNEPIK